MDVDATGFDGEGRRPAVGHDVLALVSPLAPRIAEAHRQVRAAEDREDELLAGGLRGLRQLPVAVGGIVLGRSRPGEEAEKNDEE
jgi:hypothetical protein